MKQLWATFSARFELMTLRERLMVAFAAVLLPTYLLIAVFVDPATARQRVLRANVEKKSAEIAELARPLPGIPAAQSGPNNQELRAAELRAQLNEADESLKALHKSLVPAQRIPGLLRDMLARDGALQLVSLKTLASTALIPETDATPAAGPRGGPAAAAPEAGAPGVYKHGVEITVRGTYAALHGYLARLERSPWAMYWWRAKLEADERSALTLTVTIYTLSLDKAWLEV